MKTYQLDDTLCKCGCGLPLGVVSKATYYRVRRGVPSAGWIPGHRQIGSRNPAWNGGVTVNSNGYRLVRSPGHPNAWASGWILEHRLVMSDHLGHPLLPSEIVHHKDGNKLNNAVANLVTMPRPDHGKEHPSARRIDRVHKACERCGNLFAKRKIADHRKARYCSLRCVRTRATTAAQDEQIRSLRKTMSLSALADRFGVSTMVIRRALSEQTAGK